MHRNQPKNTRVLISFFSILVSVGLLFSGCAGTYIAAGDEGAAYESGRGAQGPPPWAPAHGYRAKHRYRYYPDSYVYYDSGRRLYFYSSIGDWKAAVALPSSIHIDLDRYVVIETDTDRPYVYHSDIVKRYPPGQMKKSGKSKGKGKN